MKTHKIIALIVAACFVVCALGTGCGTSSANTKSKTNNNPAAAAFVQDDMKTMLHKLQRVDTDGYLYELSYDYDYYCETLQAAVSSVSVLDAGCSAFSTYNPEGDYLLARNYDYNHLDKNGDTTGMNLVVRTAPTGKLKSIAVCDAYWLSPGNFTKGTFDNGTTDISNVMLAPYFCVDGMNEAGVSAALLAVDTKPGETATNQSTGKEKVIHSVLLRYILDNANSVDEAIAIAKQYDVVSSAKQDIHIIVSDKSGNTAVLEWRQYGSDAEQKLYVTSTNAVTNFFVGFDDAETMYREDGSLRERFTQVTGLANTYHYGYGHGYHRFNGLVSAIDRYISSDVKAMDSGVQNAVMLNSQAYNILSVAAQEPGLEKTSLTQYSALFDMTTGSLGICVNRDYTKEYTFSIDAKK